MQSPHQGNLLILWVCRSLQDLFFHYTSWPVVFFFIRLNKHLHQNQILSSSISSLTLSLFQTHWLVTFQECNICITGKGIYFTYSIAQAIQFWINFQNGSKFYTYSSVSTIKQTTFIATDILMLIIHKQLYCSFSSSSFCLLASIFSFFKQLAKAHLKI